MNRVAKVVMDHMELPIKQMRINMVTGQNHKEKFQNLMLEVLQTAPLFKGIVKRAIVKIGQTREEKLLVMTC